MHFVFEKINYFVHRHMYKLIIIAFLITVIATIIIVSVKANDNDGVFLPIIMYHSIVADDTKGGDYSITKVNLEKDLMYLEDHGYTAIFTRDLVDYVQKGTPLPPKPVIITFDDGFLNNLTYGLPLLKKYNMKAVVSVVGSYCQKFTDTPDPNPKYAYLTWNDIVIMKHSGYFEIENHSYDMHSISSARKGSRINKGESFKDYQNVFIADTFKNHYALIDNCRITPQAYTYPYGFYTSESTQILKNIGYKATYTCDEKPNYITRNPGCLYGLSRYNRPNSMTTDQFMKKLLKH